MTLLDIGSKTGRGIAATAAIVAALSIHDRSREPIARHRGCANAVRFWGMARVFNAYKGIPGYSARARVHYRRTDMAMMGIGTRSGRGLAVAAAIVAAVALTAA